MDPLLLVLITPLLGGIVLGLVGQHEVAPEVNVGFSLTTFIAAAILTAI